MFNLATEYCFSLDRKNPKRNLRLFMLLYNLEKYVNGAEIEMKRLDRIRQLLKKELEDISRTEVPKRKNFRLNYLAIDTHFYFVCIDKAYKLISKLAVELKDPDIKKLAKRLEKTFNIKSVRDHLEHIDARCLGFLSRKDEKKKIRRHISDFGNFVNDNFTFDGKNFPSGKKSLLELKKIYTDLIEHLTQKYARKDPYFIQRQQSEEIHKKIMRKLKKRGLLKG